MIEYAIERAEFFTEIYEAYASSAGKKLCDVSFVHGIDVFLNKKWYKIIVIGGTIIMGDSFGRKNGDWLTSNTEYLSDGEYNSVLSAVEDLYDTPIEELSSGNITYV